VPSLRSLSALALLVPGLLAAPVLTTSAGAAPAPVAPVVRELAVGGVDPAAARSATAPAQSGALRVAGALQAGGRKTVLLTKELSAASFSLVGVTWNPDPAVGVVEAFVRIREDGTWSSWQPLGGTGDEQPDLGSVDTARAVRSGTSPLWVDEADGVQARVDVLTGAEPTGLRLSLVDPGESPADASAGFAPQPLSTAHAASRAPQVRTRAAWGADESIRGRSPSYAPATRAVTIHHTASSNDYQPEDVPRLLRGFYAYHVKSNGWSDIGYNFLVDKFGRIWEGRAGGIARPVVGSHAGGFNTGTVGISMIGTYETVAPSAAMSESVAQLAAWRLSAARVDPQGTLRYTSAGSNKVPKGEVVTLPTLFGHRQVTATSCPGTLGVAALPGLRSRMAALVAGAAVMPEPALPAPAPIPTPTPVPDAPVVVRKAANGLDVTVPDTVPTGTPVPVVVGGTPGASVAVWFSRRGEGSFSRRREGVVGADGTFRTSYLAADTYTLFATSGKQSSARVTTRASSLPPMQPPTMTPVRLTAPSVADIGARVKLEVAGTPGAPVQVWLRRRGNVVWSQLREGRFDAAGIYRTDYVGNEDHDYWASSEGMSSRDVQTLTRPVVAGPRTALLGAKVELAGRARPGDQVVVESRKRGTEVFVRTTLTADATGAFRTSYAADDEYEYRPVTEDRVGELHRTTVAPTAVPPDARSTGRTVTLRGTARPGATVEVFFRRQGRPSFGIAGRTTSRPLFRLGRTVVADAGGHYSTTFVAATGQSWFARSDGNVTPTSRTVVP